MSDARWHRWGIELDDCHYGPAEVGEPIEAPNVTTAWILANRRHHKGRDGKRVMVVFSLASDDFTQATRLDYSTTTGSGDPH